MSLKSLDQITTKLNLRSRYMAIFTQKLNPLNAQIEWVVNDDTYDYHQEVANAGFGDMLHDKERNEKYFFAIKKVITSMRAEGREIHVLDIGTGTGILSMMALKAGADTVTACEAFIPMANCAEKILKANNFGDRIKLIKKRSTDITIGKDMERRANLLVTEVLDTELIGEGAIAIYNHAHANLLTEDALCVPCKATCYAQVVQSNLAAQWNSLKLLVNLDGDILLKPPSNVVDCNGESSLHDVQLSQLPLDQFIPITQPVEIFEFDFNRKQPRELQRSRNILVQASRPGSANLVFFWWDIKMEFKEEILLSCAPFWAHPNFKDFKMKTSPSLPLTNVVPWRDHWMQAIYYIPKSLNLTSSGSEFILNCNHDEFSWWFDVLPINAINFKKQIKRHSCTCHFHITYSRSRIGQINQAQRNKRFLRYLENNIQKNSNVLVLGNGCILGLACSSLGASKVWCHEPHKFSRNFMNSLVECNKLNNVNFIENLEDLKSENLISLTHVFAEPYFLTSILPWDNFYFGFLLTKISKNLSESVQISPFAASIYAVPVEFLDLHKIKAPVKECEGFDLSLFDAMVEESMSISQAKVEAHPLWEYPCRALAEPVELLKVEFRRFGIDKKHKGEIFAEELAVCNGICLWVDWFLDETIDCKSMVSSGPSAPIIPGKFIKWDMFTRQGVHFINNQQVTEDSTLEWSIDFKPKSAELNFNFNIKHK
uniref:Protein arginine N-methyltransferase n=1 Tax=Glossina brevipalpis TaxID=37001 RepID=A0A1A9WE86_9MUSC